MTLPCFVQHFKTIGQLQNTLFANGISRDFNFTCASDGFPILYKAPGNGDNDNDLS